MPKKKKKKTIFLPRLLLISFAIIAAVQIVSTVGVFTSPEFAWAADDKKAPLTLPLQVPLPDMKNTKIDESGRTVVTFTGSTAPLADYIKAIYSFAIGATGILAAVVIMIGGLKWITAGGDGGKVGEAKNMILASLTGLVLALTSYLILSTVSPNLTSFAPITITGVETKEESTDGKQQNCNWKEVEKITSGTSFAYECPTGFTQTSTACGDSSTKPKLTNNDNAVLCCCKTSSGSN